MNVRIIATLRDPDRQWPRFRWIPFGQEKKYEFVKEFDLELTSEHVRDLMLGIFTLEPGIIFEDEIHVPPRECEPPGVLTIRMYSYMKEDTPEYHEELARHGWVFTKTK